MTPQGTASHALYLCYDLRAIQSYIFRVPRLKYIVGGSAIVDRFDRTTVPELVRGLEASIVFAAGGKGAVHCENETAAATVQKRLLHEAHRLGLDIRFGVASTFRDAAHGADKLYPFVPELCDGHPCEMSGLYPVSNEVQGGTHGTVRRRIFDRSEETFRHFERRIEAEKPDFGPGLAGRGYRFLNSTDPIDAQGRPDPEGRAGRAALGRDRWAVICMDGNDMGRQFREAEKLAGADLTGWIREMSGALDRCAIAAAVKGIERAVRLWSKDKSNAQIDACECDGDVILPVRPLVVGGDDIIVLCHAAYAFDFVKAATEAWASRAEEEARKFGRRGELTLWPATGNRITISSGVLFAPASLPIHAAVPYAEALLASAKHVGRGGQSTSRPTPAMIDWESVVESVLDTPAARRQRELYFLDGDLQAQGKPARVELTLRPYVVDELEDLEQDADAHFGHLPRSIRQELLPALRQGADDRALFRLRIMKNDRELASLLEEVDGRGWEFDADARRTWIPDALAILEERDRNAMEVTDA